MDKEYFIHRELALILSLFLSYFPIILNTKPVSFINVLGNGEIIFSLIALLSICMFEVLEAKLENITLTLFSFVIWFIVILIGIIIYVHQGSISDVASDNASKTSSWVPNLACLVTSIVLYSIYYRTIAMKREREKGNNA